MLKSPFAVSVTFPAFRSASHLLGIAALVGTLGTSNAADGDPVPVPSSIPGTWRGYDRAKAQKGSDSLVVNEGFLLSDEKHSDAEITLKLRAPSTAKEVQVWTGFRASDPDRRYVVGLRGGNNNQLYLARYALDARAEFLGIAPLDFQPVPGTWYTLRILAKGPKIQVYLNDEQIPRINVTDKTAIWNEGSVVLGGGYLPMEFSSLKVEPLSDASQKQMDKVGDKIWEKPVSNKEAKRQADRAAYKPAAITQLSPERAEVSLNGNWLFKPDQELPENTRPIQADADDQNWHILPVPAMWSPTLAWLFGETSFPYKGAGKMKGVSDNAYLGEIARLSEYTFDWEKTQGGWYRHYIDLPASITGKKFEIVFDAIAMVSDVWVNGTEVASHAGMFGEVRADITKALKPGKNVIAVHVLRKNNKMQRGSNKVVGVAVTVEITEDMLTRLPTDMYNFDPAGIWQPVKLVVTDPVSVADVFVQPALDKAKLDITVANADSKPAGISVAYTITSVADGSVLTQSPTAGTLDIPAGESKTITFDTAVVSPKLWTPQTPNLYDLQVTISRDGEAVDTTSTRFGFRTFEVSGNRFLLNGKPYWLRGGNHFPISLRPNDPALAETFIKLAKDGNVDVTRTHTAPLTTAWAEAADRLGLMISFEGIWPWLMLKGGVPPDDVLNSWKDDFASLVQKYRNHPSVIMWTVNNEMKFYIFDRDNPELMTRKWAVVSDMIKRMRAIDPTRPIVADSGYIRKENIKDYEAIVKPNGFDDGDIDDMHRYYCWYNPSFTTLLEGQLGNAASPDRPMISQEMSTGYPRPDDGLPTRFYLFKHLTPLALVGKYSYENNNPAYFLNRQAFLTKSLAEVIRRTNHAQISGILHFAYLTWFKNVFDKDRIEPFPTYYSLKSALSPVLVSAELFGLHHYAGGKIEPRVAIVNDSTDASDLPATKLVWNIEAAGKSLANGEQNIPAVPYYETYWTKVPITMPDRLPAPRTEIKLNFQLLSGQKVVSTNSYDLTLATPEWAQGAAQIPSGTVGFYDPQNTIPKESLPASATTLSSIDDLSRAPAVLIVAAAGKLDNITATALRSYVENGGRLLLLNGTDSVPTFLPGIVTGYRKIDGQIITMNRPGSTVFDGIEPLDMSWFEVEPGRKAFACTGVYTVNPEARDAIRLAEFCDFHAYLDKPDDVLKYTGVPLIQARIGKGTLIASEVALSAATRDPIPQRLFNNIVATLVADSKAAR